VLALAPFAAGLVDMGEPATDPAFGAGAQRLGSTGSFRFEYWEAALKGWSQDPVAGEGAGAFPVTWLRERESDDIVRDAHSLELETLAELGLVGLALLLVVFGAVAVAARRVAGADPALAAGPVAVLAAWAAHSAIDWDWEMPALTLVPVVLAGILLARVPARGQPGARTRATAAAARTTIDGSAAYRKRVEP
jgi:O-antigen ligase